MLEALIMLGCKRDAQCSRPHYPTLPSLTPASGHHPLTAGR
jgi:hypothetical protein